jgi:hypothetical protein
MVLIVSKIDGWRRNHSPSRQSAFSFRKGFHAKLLTMDKDSSLDNREQWEAYNRAAADQEPRDPKAQTWALALLYPLSALLIWIRLSRPGPELCVVAQYLLIAIGGVWITWVSIRLFIRERYQYRVWVTIFS